MKTTQKDVYKLLNSSFFSKAETEEELGYKDPFVTREQKKRDEHITRLLGKYVSFYESKVQHSKICRYIILIPCMAIILAFSALLIFLSLKVLNVDSDLNIQDVAAFITACISFISLIIGLLTIITKYFFPENDEQYITTIVESIQKNDLENKRENARFKNDQQIPSSSNDNK
ncbi:MAG: hypothetical protein Q4C65_12110 [Eubacteriales bacterium]|nr:hypothetical protein [Eubacteriales bacterium]